MCVFYILGPLINTFYILGPLIHTFLFEVF